MIRCSDNTYCHGDIFIGAGDAWLGRPNLLDPEKYTSLKDAHCDFATVLDQNNPHSRTAATMRACSVKMQPDANNAKETMLSSSEWGPEFNKEMIDEIYNYPVKAGAESKGNGAATT
ncbi:MAG: hypothetical protein BYD32DRAFT_432366 [Podila humilis]|nr:MAG: hypothetical protein BYD32DRAFT_432366 [Podila humilis]